MFLENLIESDDFCSLPHSAQALYLHLGMSADDDGLVSNPNRIMRSIVIPKKNLDLLCEKDYVIMFDSGVIAITHWLSNNCIKKDRYTPTRFKLEFSELEIKDGAMYIKAKSVICGDKTEQKRSASAPQVSIVKDSIVEDSIAKDSIVEDSIVKDSIVEDSIVKDSIDKDNIVEDSLDFDKKEKEKEKEKNPGPSVEGPGENGTPFFVSLSESDTKIENKKFISQVKLYIMTTFDTLDDKGFIDHYEKRGWLDEDNNLIFDNYKIIVNKWMRSHH